VSQPADQRPNLLKLTYSEQSMPDIRKETEGLGDVEVPTDKLWDAQAQLWLEPTVRRTLDK
jgi:hypothetical protein